MYATLYVCVYVCIYIYIYICVCVCVRVYMYVKHLPSFYEVWTKAREELGVCLLIA